MAATAEVQMDYKQFLIDCDNQYRSMNCSQNIEKQCQTCFEKEFYHNNSLNIYDCHTGCLYYAMHYGLAYISEIYHLLSALAPNNINFFNYVNITSLGGGMGTDYLAIEKYAEDHNCPFNIRYTIYDISPSWWSIISKYNTRNNILFTACDLSQQFINFSSQQIVFINKLVSTLKVSDRLSDFMKNLTSMLQTLPVGATLIFNDVNHQDKGREDFLNYMTNYHPEMQLLGKYFFPLENAYSGNYQPILRTDIIFDIAGLNNLSCDIMSTVRKTFFAVYTKVR